MLEGGSFNVNGSVRDWVTYNIANVNYIGLDLHEQKGYVDLISNVEKLPFRSESFDIVISTEVLEHVHNWRSAICEIKRVLKVGGILVLTTRGPGFPLHAYPHDYWRFDIEDFKKIFSDMRVIELQEDPMAPGVFVAAIKKSSEIKCPKIPIYSMVFCKKVSELPPLNARPQRCFQDIAEQRNEFLSKLNKMAKRPINYMRLFLYGYEPLVIPELLQLAEKCHVSTSFIECNSLRLAKKDLHFYIVSLIKGSKTSRTFYKILKFRYRIQRLFLLPFRSIHHLI